MTLQIQKLHEFLFSDAQLENVAVGPCLGQLCGSLRRGKSGTKGNHQGVTISIEEDDEDEEDEGDKEEEEEEEDEDQEEDDRVTVQPQIRPKLIQLKIIDYRASQVVVGCHHVG